MGLNTSEMIFIQIKHVRNVLTNQDGHYLYFTQHI